MTKRKDGVVLVGHNPRTCQVCKRAARVTRLAALLRENHITPEAARKETLTHSPVFKIKKKQVDTEGVI